MELRARAIVFWPGMTRDIANVRARCDDCNRNAPSQASLPSTPAKPPSVPFEAVVADYFDLAGHRYLVIADRLSGWVEIFATPSGTKQSGAQGLVDRLRNFMAIFGVPEELSSDGGPEFTASVTKDFLRRWGVSHRVSSAYNPQSNGRAEVAVKSAKRLLRSNTSSTGDLDRDRFLRAILQLRNTPDPDCGKSPAEIVFGRPLRDTLSFARRLQKLGATVHRASEVHPSWREAWAAKEAALRDRFVRQSDALNARARDLLPLEIGDRVFIQSQVGNAPKRWDKTGVVMEKGDHDQYVVKVAGSGGITTRNRRFLRRFRPISEAHQGAAPLVGYRDLCDVPLPLPADRDQLPPPTLVVDAAPPPAASPPELSPLPLIPSGHVETYPEPRRRERSGPHVATDPPLTQRQSERDVPASAADLPSAPRRSQRTTRQPKTYVPETGEWSDC